MTIVHPIEVDMYPGGTSPPDVHLSKNDTDFRIVATLYCSYGGLEIDGGAAAVLRGTKPDGSACEVPATLNAEHMTATVQGSSGLTDTAGTGVFEFEITCAGRVLSSENIRVTVEDL